jgi:hypothetical protein
LGGLMEYRLFPTYKTNKDGANEYKEVRPLEHLRIRIWYNAEDSIVAGGRSVESGYGGSKLFKTYAELKDAIRLALKLSNGCVD